MISYIVAMDLKGTIGKDNELPWHISADLKRFKKLTTGKTIVMGRKTFESIKRPLPERENVILTSDVHFQPTGCKVFHDFQRLLDYCLNQEEEIFIIGGSSLFELFFPYVEQMYVTKIYKCFEGDVFFPEIPWDDFDIIEREEGHDPKVDFQFEYLLYKKRRTRGE